ncbi:hypothetical protein [Paenibacillus sp. Z3-2]
MQPRSDEKVIVKHTPDSFFQTELHQHLESIKVTLVKLYFIRRHVRWI